jgi:uncharacterized Fe-S cluster-containing radical SAM superfamily protein
MSLRVKSISEDGKFLITNFSGSLQETDITEGSNCKGYGRVHHFKYDGDADWIRNPLPQEVASWKLGIRSESMTRAQVFQNAACNWRCWFCFVDFELLSALKGRSSFMSAGELIDLLLAEDDQARIIDLSGGQPDLIPEWPVRMMEALVDRKMQERFFLWLDDNLSVYYAWEFLKDSDLQLMKNFRNFGRVGCFKGFSGESFSENTMARPELLERQIDIMSRWVRTGLDMYGYITLTTSSLDGMREKLRAFMDSIQNNISHSFLLRTVPLEIFTFSPTATRMNPSHERALQNQYEVLSAWKDELDSRYSRPERERPIYSVPLD